MSDVPLGIFLSGGLDSSIVLAAASKLSNERLKTFSVAFEKPKAKTDISEFSELSYAKRVADFYGSEHYEYTIKSKDVMDDINNIIWHLDEPLGDPTAIPLYYVSKFAKDHVKVVLSGEGSDEIFAGYEIYREPSVIQRYKMIPYFIRRGFIEPIVRMMPFSFGKDFLRRSRLDISSRYRGVGRTFRDEEINLLLNRDLYQSLSSTLVEEYIESIFKVAELSDEINQMLYFDQKVWLPEDVLMKSDKISMANSIELRVPFLDYRLVQFACSIPSKYKYKGKCEKYILKQTFKDILPDFVLKRQKNGFPVPISSLLNGEYKDFTKDILLSQSCINRGYFNRSFIENLLNENNIRRPHVCRQIWLLLTFELWHRMYLDKWNSTSSNISLA
jgi:asparagine synthase (glutamine-hydrolysing)